MSKEKKIDENESNEITDSFERKENHSDKLHTPYRRENSYKFIDIEKLEDSPDEWKYFGPLDDRKFKMLKDSIELFGLLHPIFVWKYKDRYIIISGHERVRAYKELYEETEEKKYKRISSHIEEVKVIDEDRARYLIAIGNVQQEVSEEEDEIIRRNLYDQT